MVLPYNWDTWWHGTGHAPQVQQSGSGNVCLLSLKLQACPLAECRCTTSEREHYVNHGLAGLHIQLV